MTPFLFFVAMLGDQPAVSTPAVASDPIKGAKLICREIKMTGSRLRNKRACLTKREWDRMSDDANGTATKEWSTFSKKPERGCTLSGCI